MILVHLGLTDLFAVVVTPCDPPEAKPSPDGVLWACTQVGVATNNCVVVGDSLADLHAGAAAGAATIACLWGTSDVERLQTAGPSAVAESPSDLWAILARDPDVPTLSPLAKTP